MGEAQRFIVYARDDEGVPYAVEQVRATHWDAALADALDPAMADARVVRLRRGPRPRGLPSWLRVEVEPHVRRVADTEATYELRPREVTGARTEPTAASTSRDLDEAGDAEGAAAWAALWARSPHHRAPAAGLEEFLRAGAAALRHPDQPPLDASRQLDALGAFARRCGTVAGDALEGLVALRSTALERWLHVRFGDPDAFAEAVLLARIDAASAEDGALLRFLRAARVPADDAAFADLAVDRAVLLEQASPWRYFDADPAARPMSAALAAVRGWQRRYRRAYAQRYREAVAERGVLLTEAAEAESRFAALGRLNAIAGLGPPDGREALARLRAAVATLGAMPDTADADAATTAGIALGAPNPVAHELRTAVLEAERALLARLRRLASALAGRAVERADGDVEAVLAAIAASEVDHIDRVLDDRLAARVEALLAPPALPPSPLARVAARFPEVTRATLDAAVEAFRDAVETSLASSADGRAWLVAPPARDDAHAAG